MEQCVYLWCRGLEQPGVEHVTGNSVGKAGVGFAMRHGILVVEVLQVYFGGLLSPFLWVMAVRGSADVGGEAALCHAG